MDKSQKHYVAQKKTDTKKMYTIWVHLHAVQEQAKLIFGDKSKQ